MKKEKAISYKKRKKTNANSVDDGIIVINATKNPTSVGDLVSHRIKANQSHFVRQSGYDVILPEVKIDSPTAIEVKTSVDSIAEKYYSSDASLERIMSRNFNDLVKIYINKKKRNIR